MERMRLNPDVAPRLGANEARHAWNQATVSPLLWMEHIHARSPMEASEKVFWKRPVGSGSYLTAWPTAR